ncbi:uncharacterized protein [Haliotis asinina]|uniref:uncharacterized protein n=1 Tax=Haliotis asinina TaxID=109174 RepID=UPI0035327980
MKYRTIRDCRPLTPIEEGEGDEEDEEGHALAGEQDSCEGSDRGSIPLSLTPSDSAMTPWGELTRDGTPPLENSVSLKHTLNRMIDTATIKVVGFEENFGGRLSEEARSLMWRLCEVYGKARMAIDLVEKELLASRQEIENARQEFEEIASAESDLLQCVCKARSLREIAVKDVARWRREYRRLLDNNAVLKMKMIRYQLHHDMIESSSVDISHQNHSIKAFINICREKEKQLQRSSKNGRHVPRTMSLDSPVNSRNCSAPRKHCPKVNLSLPRPGQSTLHGNPLGHRRKTTTQEKRTVDKIASILSWNSNQGLQDEEMSPTASITFLTDTHSHLPHFTGSTVVTPDITLQSPESSGDRPSDSFRVTSVTLDRGKEAVARNERTRFESNALTDQRPGVPSIHKISTDTFHGECRGNRTFQAQVAASRKASKGQLAEDSAFHDNVTSQGGPFTSPTKVSGHTSDGTAKAEFFTTSSACRFSPTPDVVTTESLYDPTTNSSNHWCQDYRFHSDHYSYCSNRCISPVTAYRSPKLKRTSSCVQTRSVSCDAAHHETCKTGNIGQSKSCERETVLPVTNLQNYPSYLPPVPCQLYHPNHNNGTVHPPPDTRSLVIKDKKIMPSLPILGKSSTPKLSTQKHMSESMRPQQRSMSRQALPRVLPAEAPSTVYHQVLLIRSCPTEIVGKQNSTNPHSSKMYDSRCKQSINI